LDKTHQQLLGGVERLHKPPKFNDAANKIRKLRVYLIRFIRQIAISISWGWFDQALAYCNRHRMDAVFCSKLSCYNA
jgi:hypothetical protein